MLLIFEGRPEPCLRAIVASFRYLRVCMNIYDCNLLKYGITIYSTSLHVHILKLT